MISVKSIKKTLSGLYQEYADNYQRLIEADRYRKKAALKAGERAPSDRNTRFYDAAMRDEFAATAADIRGRWQDVIDDTRAEIDKMKSEAPSTEAVNAVNMLKMLEKPTLEELQAIMDRYGDNYLISRAVSEIAKKNKYTMTAPALETLSDRLKELERDGLQLNVFSAEKNGVSTGQASFFETMLDLKLPDTILS